MIEALEAALAEDFSHENLQVYGDALEAAGDPRGQLIAIDLHIARHGRSQELDYRRRQRLRDWLELSRAVDPTKGPWQSARFAFGFVEDLRTPIARKVLRSPAGRYVRGISLSGRGQLSDLMYELGAAPRPWLERLTITSRVRHTTSHPVWTGHSTVFDRSVIPSVIAATPRLRLLELAGQHLVVDFPHPQLRALRVHGIDAFLPILEPRDPLPALRELELAFASEQGAPVLMLTPWPALVPAASFPALTRLDLSENWVRPVTDTQIGVFDVLPQLAARDTLEELRLWGVTDELEADQIRIAAARMPRLRRLELEHLPRTALALDGVSIARVEPHWPREAGAIGEVWMTVPGDTPLALPLARLVRHCQLARSWLAPGDYAAWQTVWQNIEALPYGAPGTQVSSTILRRALDALWDLEWNHRELSAWCALRTLLHNRRDECWVWMTLGYP